LNRCFVSLKCVLSDTDYYKDNRQVIFFFAFFDDISAFSLVIEHSLQFCLFNERLTRDFLQTADGMNNKLNSTTSYRR